MNGSRSDWLRLTIVLAAIFAGFLFSISPTAAQIPLGNTSTGGRIPTITFEQRLKLGLRVKTTADAQFVNKVITLVDQGKIPVALVDSTFFWARQKGYYRGGYAAHNPMVYFRPAMRIRARAIGVVID